MINKLENALQRRSGLPDGSNMVRLVNGFSEALPKLVIEIYGRTILISDHSAAGDWQKHLPELKNFLVDKIPFVNCIISKWRNSKRHEEINGKIIHGSEPDRYIIENRIKYAVDLTLNQDSSFYGDTAFLRQYLRENSRGKRVLNTFAYTGSLGIAALAGGAAKVVQTDLSGRFLELAKRSCSLNALPDEAMETVTGNFFPVVSGFKKKRQEFDLLILDPPFFSATAKGTVDLLKAPAALINKLRPIAADGAVIIAVNNALFLSGKDFMSALNEICDGYYLKLETTIPVPAEFCGAGDFSAIAAPEPFNHPTKIAVLRVKRKESEKACQK